MIVLELLDTCPEIHIADTFIITGEKIERYKKPMCSVSGGADSDMMIDIISKVDSDKKTIFVFFNTGLEYRATLEHLDYLEKKYGIQILREKAIKPIPISCKKYGVPFLSKHVSEMIYRLQKHDFKWEDRPYEELVEKYPNCKSALQWWCNRKIRNDGKIGMLNIDRDKYLKEFMIQNPPDFPISSKCCTHAKKNVARNFRKKHNVDLEMVGIRKSEGGIRSVQYKTCFTPGYDCDSYRPIFWITDDVKKLYSETYGVKNSRCYTDYGLSRTGCVGCPFNKNFEDELYRIQKHEPLLFKAVNNIFGKSYEYTRKYREYVISRETF